MNKRNILRSIIVVIAIVCIVSVTVVAYKSNKSPSGSNDQQKTAAENTTTKQESSANEVKTEKTGTQGPDSNNSGTGNNGAAGNNGTTENSDPAKVSEAKKVKVKGLYLTGWTMGSDANIKHYIELAKTTEINSYVIDIKDDDGLVGYESGIPAVRDIKAWEKKYDVDKVIKGMHESNIHIIGRIVCFKDPVLSSKRLDLAIKNANGGLWRDNHGLTWLNPYNKDSWPYLVDIAKEAVKKGFDEIQFDYIRFANDGNKKLMDFGNTGGKQKYEAIDEFLAYARKELPGVILSADVFGIICESPADTEGIGQNLEYVGKDVDYLSPMAYPSHYAVGQIVNKVKFVKPDLEPYGVVYNTLAKAKDRVSKVQGYKANMRPYLQDFTASWLGKGYYQSYGPDQVRQQIKAVYDAGYDEWILWDANNKYSESALQKEN